MLFLSSTPHFSIHFQRYFSRMLMPFDLWGFSFDFFQNLQDLDMSFIFDWIYSGFSSVLQFLGKTSTYGMDTSDYCMIISIYSWMALWSSKGFHEWKQERYWVDGGRFSLSIQLPICFRDLWDPPVWGAERTMEGRETSKIYLPPSCLQRNPCWSESCLWMEGRPWIQSTVMILIC